MSAFMIDGLSLNLIVKTAIDCALVCRLTETGEPTQISQDNATELGRMLWRENARSVAYRYPCHEAENAANAALADEFLYEPRIGEMKPIQALKLVKFLDYQSCEADNYNKTLAAQALCSLAGFLFLNEISLDMNFYRDWSDAPWGAQPHNLFEIFTAA